MPCRSRDGEDGQGDTRVEGWDGEQVQGVMVEHLALGELWWEGGEVPRLHLIPTELNPLDVLDLGELLMLSDLRHVKVAMLRAVVILVLAPLVPAAWTHMSRGQVSWCKAHGLGMPELVQSLWCTATMPHHR